MKSRISAFEAAHGERRAHTGDGLSGIAEQARLIGETVTVVDAIVDGRGRVKVGDGVWPAKGADCEVGTKVRITGADGTVLVVEAAN